MEILFLGTKWKYDSFGIAALNESLINDVWNIDPEGSTIQMKCAVFDHLTEESKKDASLSSVELIGAKLPRGQKEFPDDISALDIHCINYFQDVDFNKRNFTFIVGHVPFLGNAPYNMSTYLKKHYNQVPRVILVIHDLPRDKDNKIDDRTLTELVQDAYLILSVGHQNFEWIEDYMDLRNVIHKLYLPYCPVEFFKISRPKVTTNDIKHSQHFLTFAAGKGTEEARGIDYNLAVKSSAMAVDRLLSTKMCRNSTEFHFITLGTSKNEKQLWQNMFESTTGNIGLEYNRLDFQYHELGGIENIKKYLKMGTLCSVHLKRNYCTLGIEALWALFAGIPVLVSSSAGISPFLKELYPGACDLIVDSYGNESRDSMAWAQKIQQQIQNPIRSQVIADVLQKRCLDDISIPKTHLDFVGQVISDITGIPSYLSERLCST